MAMARPRAFEVRQRLLADQMCSPTAHDVSRKVDDQSTDGSNTRSHGMKEKRRQEVDVSPPEVERQTLLPSGDHDPMGAGVVPSSSARSPAGIPEPERPHPGFLTSQRRGSLVGSQINSSFARASIFLQASSNGSRIGTKGEAPSSRRARKCVQPPSSPTTGA